MKKRKNRNKKPAAVISEIKPESFETPASQQSEEKAAGRELTGNPESGLPATGKSTVIPAKKTAAGSGAAGEEKKASAATRELEKPAETCGEPDEKQECDELETKNTPESLCKAAKRKNNSNLSENADKKINETESHCEPHNETTGKAQKIVGRLMMGLGVILILLAVLLYSMNEKEAETAAKASEELLPQVREVIVERVESTEPAETVHISPYDQEAVQQSMEMTEQVINGWRYIGYLSIPDLDLELPVLSDWSHRKLQIAPCRHMGSTKSDDLVIAAHNYPNHFGRIKELQQGDPISFVDMDGVLSTYQVVTVNVIAPTAIEEVQAEELDLVLYTCTYGGRNRVMVGCQRTEN